MKKGLLALCAFAISDAKSLHFRHEKQRNELHKASGLGASNLVSKSMSKGSFLLPVSNVRGKKKRREKKRKGSSESESESENESESSEENKKTRKKKKKGKKSKNRS
ncbi:hypothetical protein EROM_020100 [Encephalitozoon romaleae SJ-2008]|uniref:Uncharacterized protein n=1 Tax=Encephalitozoon romaleae (strain SJ-2008) TaxID=1178016 RepID=I7AD09_ENCRO|nr:hypothetical protein EROM_020100 [Encephalitozoon romaleae SJ-2008]AFN82485.1 hypothetical protein EROM_020100 [Encephalitozoon romaleae SJ-2008]